MSKGSSAGWLAGAVIAAVLAGCGDEGTSNHSVKSRTTASSTVARPPSNERIEQRRARRIRKGLDAIARHVDVPVVLPSNLPKGATLGDRTQTQLILRFGLPRFLVIEYGGTILETCDGFRRVMVGDAPGLMSIGKVRPDGADRYLPYITVIWPATPELPRGRYGLSGTFSLSDTLAFARAMKGTTSFRPRATKTFHCFESIDAALEYIRGRVDVPVAVPSGLPKGVTVEGGIAVEGHAQLHLRFPGRRVRLPGRRVLIIQYGKAGFDGCGPTNPRAVRVGKDQGLLNEPKPYGRDPVRRTLVWPATLKHPVGHYALTGELSAKQMLALAESMNRSQTAKPPGATRNC
jgi:hypothetical protein